MNQESSKLMEDMSSEELQQAIVKLEKEIVAYGDNPSRLLAAEQTGTTIDDQGTHEERVNDVIETEIAPKMEQMHHKLAELQAELRRRSS